MIIEQIKAQAAKSARGKKKLFIDAERVKQVGVVEAVCAVGFYDEMDEMRPPNR